MEIKNSLVKNFFSAIFIALMGFILLNITFVFYAVTGTILMLFLHGKAAGPIAFIVSNILIFIISWFVFQSKKSPLLKATFLVVPTAVILVTDGMLLYRWPVIVYPLGIIVCLATMYYLHKNKLSWLYYYSVILVGIALLIFSLVGGEI